MQYMLSDPFQRSRDAVPAAGRPRQDARRLHGLYRRHRAGRRGGEQQPPAPHQATTTVRVVDGKTQVLDGPYAETRNSLPATI